MAKQSTIEFLQTFHDIHKSLKLCLDCAEPRAGGYLIHSAHVNDLRGSFAKLDVLLGGGVATMDSPHPIPQKNKP